MPRAFDQCVKHGGRVRTVKPKRGGYLHVCFKGGKSYSGEVKKTKASKAMNRVSKARRPGR